MWVSLAMSGAEALIRIRHPTWGIVPPAHFIPSDGDPHFCALSEFVIGRAVDDWRNFVSRHGHVELAINLPITFLQHSDYVSRLCRLLPDHPAFEGLLIEIDGVEIIRNLQSARELARQLRFHKIGISIDDLGAEWPALMELQDFPFVEIKVDRKFVAGCADDRLKQVVCRRILEARRRRRRPHGRGRRRNPDRFSCRARDGLRPGARLSFREADAGTQIRAHHARPPTAAPAMTGGGVDSRVPSRRDPAPRLSPHAMVRRQATIGANAPIAVGGNGRRRPGPQQRLVRLPFAHRVERLEKFHLAGGEQRDRQPSR